MSDSFCMDSLHNCDVILTFPPYLVLVTDWVWNISWMWTAYSIWYIYTEKDICIYIIFYQKHVDFLHLNCWIMTHIPVHFACFLYIHRWSTAYKPILVMFYLKHSVKAHKWLSFFLSLKIKLKRMKHHLKNFRNLKH